MGGPARSVGLLVLLAIIVAAFSPSVYAGSPRYTWTRTISVVVPAVSYVDGVYTGVVSTLEVTVAWPGNGTVYFAADPLTEVDTQAAARMAVLVASILAGVDYHSYDYFIHLRAPAPVVGGPSASGAMAVAVLAALREKWIPRNFSMTGMVEPDAVLGPVGGIPQKLRAVAEAGVKRFAIPLGQDYAVDLNTGRMVDVVALGSQLGVNVTPVATVLDAYIAATGDTELLHRLLAVALPGYPPSLVEDLKRIITVFEDVAMSNLTCWRQISKKLPADAYRVLSRHAMLAEQLLETARKSVESHLYYSAASYAFRAAIEATFACKAAEALVSNNPLKVASEFAESVIVAGENYLLKANATLTGLLSKGVTDVSLQLAVTALSRMDVARELLSYLNTSIQNLSPSTLLDTLYTASYAYYRSLTALQWAESSAREAARGVALKTSKVREAISAYLYFAKTEAEYLEALGISPSDSLEKIDEAYQLLEKGGTYNTLRALALAVDTVSTLTLTLHRAFSVDIRDSIKAADRSLELLLRLDVLEYNVTPVIPLLYYEYAIASSDLETRLSMLVEASSYAVLLASVAAKPSKPPSPLTPRTAARTVTVTVTKPVTVTAERTIAKTVTSTMTATVTSVSTVEKTVRTTVTAASTKTVSPGPPIAGVVSNAIIMLIIGLAIGYAIARARRG